MRLTIEKAIYGGAGLARVEGKAVFVPMALPGETVEAAVRRDKGSFAEAELLEVVASSPDRVAALCPYYGACGGCQYQHTGYASQLAMKRAILVETLGRAGLESLPRVETHAAEPWGYRNRIRLHVDGASHALGYRRRASHTLLPVNACPIAAPLLQHALQVLQGVLRDRQAGAWCAGLELFTNENSSALLLSLEQRAGSLPPANALDQICAAVQEQMPELCGAGLFAAKAAKPSRGRREPLADEPEGESAAGTLIGAWGERSLMYRVGAEAYRVSLGAFFQGNRLLVQQLVTLACDGESGSHAWDLFAGVGLFARPLSAQFERVTAIEGAPVSANDLRHNIAGQRVVESSTLAFLEREAGRRTPPPDRVVLDPPRAGLGKQASALLARVRSAHITYVSCDPATLARDLRILVDAGYTLTRLHLVDMFPQTFHLETVAVLRLG